MLAQPGTVASWLGCLLTPEREAQEILQGLGLQGHSLAQRRGQWMGGLWPQLASVSSPAGQHQGVGVPSLANEPVLLAQLVGGQQTPGGGRKPRLGYLERIARGRAGSQEAPLKTLTIFCQLPPCQLLEQSVVVPPPSLLSLLFPEHCPPPEQGGSTLCCWFWGQEASTSGT